MLSFIGAFDGIHIIGLVRKILLREISAAVEKGTTVCAACLTLGVHPRRYWRWRREARRGAYGRRASGHRTSPNSLSGAAKSILLVTLRSPAVAGHSVRWISDHIFNRHGIYVSPITIWKYRRTLPGTEFLRKAEGDIA